MSSVRFITADAQSSPTVLGLLVAGKFPRQWLPGAYVQFGRYDGLEMADPIADSKEIDGPLPEMMQGLDDIFQANIAVALDLISQPREIRQPTYPITALRQAVYNAILHRTYESTHAPVRIMWFQERIEILSPGGPYGQVSRDNFAQPGITDYRNPNLAEAMKNLGYVQRFGMGIPLIYQELERNGNPPPEFVAEDSYVWSS